VAQSPQAQPEQTVALAKTSVRTSEDAELVPQGHHLENEVSPGVQGRADPRRDGQEDLKVALSRITGIVVTAASDLHVHGGRTWIGSALKQPRVASK
jgi:hypothetical protein